MKIILITLASFALLPFALPAIMVFVVMASLIAYWLVPILWVTAVVFVVLKLWRRYLGTMGMGNNRIGDC